jgi:diadenosine tetraphosphate (Ap4A) HIT family hydrolase
MAFAIRDGYPVSPGHTLAIPYRHVGSFFDLSSQEHDALFEIIREQKRILDIEFSHHAFNIGINDGPAAGQTVPHLHVHLIPRYRGDVADPRGRTPERLEASHRGASAFNRSMILLGKIVEVGCSSPERISTSDPPAA